jgi:hypothetical protein
LEELINSRLPSPLGRAQIEDLLARLVKSGRIVQDTDGVIRLSENTTQEITARERDLASLILRVQRKFTSICASAPSEAQISWAQFETHFIQPLVAELGARTYQLLSAKPNGLPQSQTFLRVLDLVSEAYRGALADILQRLFDPKDPDIRAYILRNLNAALLVQAVALSQQTLDGLNQRTTRQLKLRIIVDTNFLFSLIGLHENPADDVVKALKHLITELKDRLSITLYVLPITIDEAKRTLIAYEDRLRPIRVTPTIAAAARNHPEGFSGISLKFFDEAGKAKRSLTSKQYFQPYQENLLAVLRSKGVELYNQPTEHLSMDQAVINDVLSQVEYDRRIRGDAYRKSYEKWLHDVVLWHFTRRSRPPRIESPMDASFWVATIDFGFLGYDRFKCRVRDDSIPVCIHPTVLLQLLQFWIPRSDVLDAALTASIQPLVPHVFDHDAELLTFRILGAISRYSDIQDLSLETTEAVLFDSALRARVSGTSSVDEQIVVVHDALVAHLSSLQRRASQLEDEKAGLARQVEERELHLSRLRVEAKVIEDAARAEASDLRRSLQAEQDSNRALATRLGQLESQLRVRQAAQTLAAVSVLSGLALGALAFLLAPWVAEVLILPPSLSRITVYVITLGLELIVIDLVSSKLPVLSKFWPVRFVNKARKTLWSIVGGLLLGLVCSELWDLIMQYRARAPK